MRLPSRHSSKTRSYRPRLEALEERWVPTSTLYIDYGDRFVGDQLVTTVGALDSTVAGDNPDIDGPELTSSEGSTYDDDRIVRINSVNSLYRADAAEMRRVMTAQARRAFAPLDVTVVELTTNYQTVHGHRVRAAASLADISRTLGVNEGDAENNDAYVIVGQFLIGPNNANPITFTTNGYGGLATGTDIDDDNDNDGTAFVLLVGDGSDSAAVKGDVIAHEAGHLFGLQHAYRQDGNSLGADYDMLHQSEVMSYLRDRSTYNFFSRFPMIEGDGNDDRDDLAAEPTPFDQMRRDPNIGPADGDGLTRPAALEYVTGTGAHDVITITKTGPNSARVNVAAYTDAAHTSLIRVPGPDGGGSYSYDITLDRPLRIDAGGNNDRVVLSGDLGVQINLRGMHGDDELVVFGGGAASGHYNPAAAATTGVDGNPDYRGTVTYGNTVVYFQEFEPTSRVSVQFISNFTVRTAGSADQLTIGGDSAFGPANTLSGASDGVAIVPLYWRNVRSFTLDTETADRSGPAANDNIRLNAPGLVAPGLVDFTVTTGNGVDGLEVLTSNLTMPSPGGSFRFNAGAGVDKVIVQADTNYLLNQSALFGGGGSITLSSVAQAFLTGGVSDNIFTLGDWTGAAWFDGIGGHDKLVATRDVDFTLRRISDSLYGMTVEQLSLSDGTQVRLIATEEASLSDLTAARNRVTVNNARFSGPGLDILAIDTFEGDDTVIVTGTSASLTINTGPGQDRVTISNTARSGATIETGTEADHVTVDRISGTTSVNGGDHDDIFDITPNTGSINAVFALHLDGGRGANQLTVHDHNNPYNGGRFNHRYDVTSTSVKRFEEAPRGLLPVEIPLNFVNVGRLTLNAGAQGDTINVESTPGLTTIDGGLGADTIRVTPDTRNIADALGLSVRDTGVDQADAIVFYDQNYPFFSTGLPGVYRLTASVLERYFIPHGQTAPALLPIGFTGIEQVDLRTSAGPDVFQVQGTPGNTTINSGASLDQFIVGPDLTQLRGKLTIDAAAVPGEPNVLVVDDRASPLGILHYNQLNVAGSRTTVDVNFSPRIDAGGISAMTFYGSGAGDFFSVRATAVPTAIYGGAGNDIITVASASGALADALGGALHLSGDADTDILDVSDANAAAGGAYTMTSTAFYVSDTTSRELFTYSVDDLRIILSNHPDRLDITANPYPALVSVNGGGSDGDILTGSNLVNLFLILGLDSGLHTYGTTSYASFENLHGGSGTDLFVFQGGSVSGSVQGMGGTDTLNYTGRIESVQVSLPEGRASAVGGGAPGRISGIENVVGGWGDDELIGDDQANGFSGGEGNDTLIGGDGQDILVGGTGVDVLFGGSGEDFLIGGSLYIANPIDYGLTLITLRNHWAQTDAYFERIDLLRNDLLATPVEEDAEFDELCGEGDRDWFWGAQLEVRDHEEDLLEVFN